MTGPIPPLAPTVRLRHGAEMPRLGFGTYPLDDTEAEHAVATAIENGYRLIDTAALYGNEIGVGRGCAAAASPATSSSSPASSPRSSRAPAPAAPSRRAAPAWAPTTSTCTSSTGPTPPRTPTWRPSGPWPT